MNRFRTGTQDVEKPDHVPVRVLVLYRYTGCREPGPCTGTCTGSVPVQNRLGIDIPLLDENSAQRDGWSQQFLRACAACPISCVGQAQRGRAGTGRRQKACGGAKKKGGVPLLQAFRRFVPRLPGRFPPFLHNRALVRQSVHIVMRRKDPNPGRNLRKRGPQKNRADRRAAPPASITCRPATLSTCFNHGALGQTRQSKTMATKTQNNHTSRPPPAPQRNGAPQQRRIFRKCVPPLLEGTPHPTGKPSRYRYMYRYMYRYRMHPFRTGTSTGT